MPSHANLDLYKHISPLPTSQPLTLSRFPSHTLQSLPTPPKTKTSSIVFYKQPGPIAVLSAYLPHNWHPDLHTFLPCNVQQRITWAHPLCGACHRYCTVLQLTHRLQNYPVLALFTHTHPRAVAIILPNQCNSVTVPHHTITSAILHVFRNYTSTV